MVTLDRCSIGSQGSICYGPATAEYGCGAMTMEYKGFAASPTDFDPEDGTFSGIVLGLKG